MICFIGVGSLGKNLLDSYLKRDESGEEIIVIDNDHVENHDTQYDKKYVNEKKVDACANQYKEYNLTPMCDYVVNKKLSSQLRKIFDKASTIFDCRDTFETRDKFEAIKLYISGNRLIADFRKQVSYKKSIESDYHIHIEKSYIKTLTNQFVKFYNNNKNNIGYKNKAISLNQFGSPLIITPSKNIIESSVIHEIESNPLIKKVKVEIRDVPYLLYENEYDMQETKTYNIVEELMNRTDHMIAVNVISTLKDGVMKLDIFEELDEK